MAETTNYLVTELSSEEGGTREAEEMTETQLIEKYAPGFDRSKASHTDFIDEWVAAFVGMSALQVAAGVHVEKVDSKKLFETHLQKATALEEQLSEVSKKLVPALVAVLSDLTAEEIAKGEVHSTSATAKKVGIVEYYLKLSKVTPKSLIAKHKGEFPEAVEAELVRIRETRAAVVNERMNRGKSAASK